MRLQPGATPAIMAVDGFASVASWVAQAKSQGECMRNANLFCVVAVAILGLGCGQDYKITEEPRDFVLNPELVDLGDVAVGEPVLFEVDATSVGGGDISILAIEIINIEGEYVDLAEDGH
jgi:hypothetical protein